MPTRGELIEKFIEVDFPRGIRRLPLCGSLRKHPFAFGRTLLALNEDVGVVHQNNTFHLSSSSRNGADDP